MKLSKDLREFVALLNAAEVKYLLVGGHALAYHGYPRYTGDVDFFVEMSPGNAAALESVLKEFGFGELDIARDDFLQPETIVQLGRPPNRIDLITSISGVTFAEAWEARVRTEIDGLPVGIISKALLVRNKRASNRPKDVADLAELLGDEPPE
jgi:hypothetical protein